MVQIVSVGYDDGLPYYMLDDGGIASYIDGSLHRKAKIAAAVRRHIEQES